MLHGNGGRQLTDSVVISRSQSIRHIGLLCRDNSHDYIVRYYGIPIGLHPVPIFSLLGTEKVIHYTLLSGDQALNRAAPEQALGYFESARSAMGDSKSDSQAARVLFGLGVSQTLTGNRDDAGDNLRQSYETYRLLGDTDSALDVAIFPFPAFHHPNYSPMIRDALTVAPPGSVAQGLLLSKGGSLRSKDFDSDFEEALEIAQHHGDRSLEMWTLGRQGASHWAHMRWSSAADLLAAAAETGREIGDLAALEHATRWAGMVAQSTGRTEIAEQRYEEAQTAAARSQDQSRLELVTSRLLTLSRMLGDWERCMKHVSDLESLLGIRGAWESDWVASILFETGNVSEGEQELSKVLEQAPDVQQGGQWAPLWGHMCRINGSSITGEWLAETSPIEGPTPMLRHHSLQGQAMKAILANDASSAVEILAALDYTDAFQFESCISSPRIKGLLAHTTGDLDAAVRHYVQAKKFTSDAGYKPELAWTCHDYAETLLQRDATGDRKKATELQDEAIAIATELGMKPLLERVLAQR